MSFCVLLTWLRPKLSDRVSIPDMKKISLPYNFHISSAAHPNSYPMGTGGGLSLGIGRQEREADYSPPSSAQIKNDGTISPVAHMSLWHTALLHN
jgi:hypothetical protein